MHTDTIVCAGARARALVRSEGGGQSGAGHEHVRTVRQRGGRRQVSERAHVLMRQWGARPGWGWAKAGGRVSMRGYVRLLMRWCGSKPNE